MPPLLQSQLLPETAPEILSQFAVRGPLAIRAVLDDLVRERPLVSLYSSRNFDQFVVSQILGWDESGVRFDFVTDQGRRSALLGADRVVILAFLDRIKIQFDALELSPGAEGDKPILRCAVPQVLYRIQRRETFRVRPAGRINADCVVRMGAGDERVYRVADISAGGLGLTLPPGEPLPASGDSWQHCRLEIPGYPAIPCSLAVRVVADGLRGDSNGTRIGCEFIRPTPQAQRAVQLYVMDLERGRAPVGEA